MIFNIDEVEEITILLVIAVCILALVPSLREMVGQGEKDGTDVPRLRLIITFFLFNTIRKINGKS